MIILASLTSLLVFLSLWGFFYQRQREWRFSFLSASVVWGILLTAFLEVLGHFKLITFWWVLGAWGLVFVATLPWAGETIINLKAWLKSFPSLFITPFELSLLAGICFIMGAVGLIAWIAPPNTVDSMIYHMARVMHWMQDRSVDYYPTHILRQLYLSPWSEFAILNFQVLIGTDRLANFVQWFSMVGSAVGVSLIAKEFGADRRGQIFSAFVSTAIPMGIVQGSSTQNDYTATFWRGLLLILVADFEGKTAYLALTGSRCESWTCTTHQGYCIPLCPPILNLVERIHAQELEIKKLPPSEPCSPDNSSD